MSRDSHHHSWEAVGPRRRRCVRCQITVERHQDRAGTWLSWQWPDGRVGDDRLSGLLPDCAGSTP